MQIEYIFLLILSFLPIIYKLGYWEDYFMNNRSLFTKQGREYFFHFWLALEIPFLFGSVFIFYAPLFEIMLFGMFFYFLVLYNVFVIGKVVRKKMLYPSLRGVLLLGIGVMGAVMGALVYDFPTGVYSIIVSTLTCMPAIYYITGKMYRFLIFRGRCLGDRFGK